ncbi:MAG: hypothetical protein JWM05_2127 [Acidimicrobiales bacterium]|nr:hypothetical protein [Acidimicrobiales bacterium]
MRRGFSRVVALASTLVMVGTLAQCADSGRSATTSSDGNETTGIPRSTSTSTASRTTATPPTSPTTRLPVSPPTTAGPAPAFHDGFDGVALDASRWGTCYWWATEGGCSIVTNDEAEWYQPQQVSVRDGALHLQLRPGASTHLGHELPYVSGMVSSGRASNEPTDRPRFAFTYGTVSVRFRTPKAAGLWPAIWLLPSSNSSLPEVDLLEQYGANTTHAGMNLHATDSGGHLVNLGEFVATPDLSTGWHTIRLEWAPGSLRWLLDGVERYSASDSTVPREPMYLIMNLAGGGVAGFVDDSRLPAELLIDQVDIWTGTVGGATARPSG